MKSLYESILDSDEKINKQAESALIREFIRIVTEYMPDMKIAFTPKKDFIVGESDYPGMGNYGRRKELVNELKEVFGDRMTFNETFYQIHINIQYKNDSVHCSLIRTSTGVRHQYKYVLNISADKKSTLNTIKKICDEIIPF